MEMTLSSLVDDYQGCLQQGSLSFSELRNAVETLQQRFVTAQKQGIQDRKTFNLDFDLKQLLQDIQEDLKGEHSHFFEARFKELLSDCKNWLETEALLESKGPSGVESGEWSSPFPGLREASKRAIFKPKPRGAVDGMAMRRSPGLDQVNQIIVEQQDNLSRLRLANERWQQLRQDSETLEKKAAQEQSEATEAARVAAELVLEADAANNALRQMQGRLAEATQQVGLESNQLGAVERIQAEILAAEGRAKNIEGELNHLLGSVRSGVQVMRSFETYQPLTVLYDVHEQLRFALLQAEEAQAVFSKTVENLIALGHVMKEKVAKSVERREEAVLRQQKHEVSCQEARNRNDTAHNRLLQQQNAVTDKSERASEWLHQAEQLRTELQQATLDRQAASAERALIADRVRLAIQEAAQLEAGEEVSLPSHWLESIEPVHKKRKKKENVQ